MELATKSYVSSRDQSYIILFLTGFIGISLVLGGFYLNYKKSTLSFTGSVPNSLKSYFVEHSEPIEISFINLGLTVPIENSVIKNGMWNTSPNSASYLTTSAKPGESGNIVIYGHNKKNVFGSIKNVQNGELINLNTKNGEIKTYEVKDVFEVNPDKIEVIAPTDKEILTIFTCSGFLDSNRLIIKAEPIGSV